MATVSQFAAPMDGEAPFLPAYGTTPPTKARKWRQFRRSQPAGTARSHSDLSQEPMKTATVSQFAAPLGGQASF